MTITVFRKELADLLKGYLDDYNFKLIAGDTDGYSLIHQTEELLLLVVFQKKERADGMEISVGSEFIQFKEVEAIWYPIMLQYKMYDTAMPPTSYDMTFRQYKNDSKSDWHQRSVATLIDIKEDVKRYSELLKGYLEAVSFPWFQQYSRLEVVNGFIKSMDDAESVPWFASPHMFRKLIIKKLCNDSSYETYLGHWKERLDAAKDLEGGIYLPYLQAINELEQVLKTK